MKLLSQAVDRLRATWESRPFFRWQDGTCRVEKENAGKTQAHSGHGYSGKGRATLNRVRHAILPAGVYGPGIVLPSRNRGTPLQRPLRPTWSVTDVEEGVKMMKGCITTAAVIGILAVGVQAGEIKLHEWPCQFVSVEITSIPVVMDVGYWVKIKDQDKLRIKLVQDEQDIHKFKGCTDMVVESNFNLILSCSISKTGAIGGDYSCTVNPTDCNAGSTTVQVCATLKNANLSGQPGGSKDVQVATVKIKVKPQ